MHEIPLRYRKCCFAAARLNRPVIVETLVSWESQERTSPGFLMRHSWNSELHKTCGIRHGLIHLEARVVAHSEWRERESIVGGRGSDAHRVPAPTPFGDVWNEQRGLEQCNVQRLELHSG